MLDKKKTLCYNNKAVREKDGTEDIKSAGSLILEN